MWGIESDVLEAKMKQFVDVKKDFAYDKSQGTWAWFDRDEKDNPDAWHKGFDSFYEMLSDAVEPYFGEEEL
jgi:hypothetical protein